VTNKPDVAALAREKAEYIVRNFTRGLTLPPWERLIEAIASELTRLAAERDALAEGRDGAFDLLADRERELSEAKAEIARLTDLAQQRKWQLEECESDLAKAEAEIARLRAVAQEDPEREAHDRLGEFFGATLKPDTGEGR